MLKEGRISISARIPTHINLAILSSLEDPVTTLIFLGLCCKLKIRNETKKRNFVKIYIGARSFTYLLMSAAKYLTSEQQRKSCV